VVTLLPRGGRHTYARLEEKKVIYAYTDPTMCSGKATGRIGAEHNSIDDHGGPRTYHIVPPVMRREASRAACEASPSAND
jgi:hypothetical protein